jgi:hypothetical protein
MHKKNKHDSRQIIECIMVRNKGFDSVFYRKNMNPRIRIILGTSNP